MHEDRILFVLSVLRDEWRERFGRDAPKAIRRHWCERVAQGQPQRVARNVYDPTDYQGQRLWLK